MYLVCVTIYLPLLDILMCFSILLAVEKTTQGKKYFYVKRKQFMHSFEMFNFLKLSKT